MTSTSPDGPRVLALLSQIVTCRENCPACRAAAEELLGSGTLDLDRCAACGHAFAPALGPCGCTRYVGELSNPAAAAFHAASGEKPPPELHVP